MGASFIKKEKFIKEQHIILCQSKKCCFSTSNSEELDIHCQESSHDKLNDQLLVLSRNILPASEANESNQCPR